VIGVERDVVIEAVEFGDGSGEIVVSCRLRAGCGASMRSVRATLRPLRPG
jgi:hypothetical protein